uniref:Cuticle protein n=1 Tax=Strongyloides venezuelensis TaxID=75913 RepID=A0A0K0F2W7_STRVS
MNTKLIVAIIATIIATISGQYYYAPSYGYASYYPYAATYSAYAPVAAAPVVGAPVVGASVVPSAFAPVAYAWGSNKGKNDTEALKAQENVKLTN